MAQNLSQTLFKTKSAFIGQRVMLNGTNLYLLVKTFVWYVVQEGTEFSYQYTGYPARIQSKYLIFPMEELYNKQPCEGSYRHYPLYTVTSQMY